MMKQHSTKFIIIFLTFYFYSCESKKVIFSEDPNIAINENELLFIESPNFPFNITKDIGKNSTLFVTGKSNKKEDLALIFVVNSGELREVQKGKGQVKRYDKKPSISFNSASDEAAYFFTKLSYFNFSTISSLPFQGYIVYEKFKKDSCPLSDRVIKLADETQIINLRTTYALNEKPSMMQNCTWKFLAPKGYGFKFVIRNYTDNERFEVVNSTQDIITSGYTATKYKAYYNHDSNITIFYHGSSSQPISSSDDGGFNAYISIVKQNIEKIPIICNLKTFACDKTFMFSSSNKTLRKINEGGCKRFIWLNPHNYTGYGYPNNGICEKLIRIEPHQQLYLGVSYLHSERNVDMVKFFNGSDDAVGTILEKKNITILFPHENGIQKIAKDVRLKFESDGSVQGNGFVVDMEIIDCKCADQKIVIPCSGFRNYSLMGEHTYKYCGDLACNFTITMATNKKCLKKYGLLEFNTAITGLSVKFHIISNNEIILNSTIGKRTALITPESQTTLIFKSTKFHKVASESRKGFLQLIVSANKGPKTYPTIILTKENPSSSLDMTKEHTAITVKLSNELKEEHDLIETVFLPLTSAYDALKCFTMFGNENFTNVLGGLKYYNVENPVSLTVYRHHNCTDKIITIMFRAKKVQAKNCHFDDTIFQIRAKENRTISMISNGQGQCSLILANQVVDSNNIFLSKIWTNAKNNNKLIIYSGLDHTFELMELSDLKLMERRIIAFNTLFFIIVIPPNSSIIMEFYPYLIPFELTPSLVNFFNASSTSEKEDINVIYEIGNNETSFVVDAIDIVSKKTLNLLDEFRNYTRFTSAKKSAPIIETTIQIYSKEPQKSFKELENTFMYFKVSQISKSFVSLSFNPTQTTKTFIQDSVTGKYENYLSSKSNAKILSIALLIFVAIISLFL